MGLFGDFSKATTQRDGFCILENIELDMYLKPLTKSDWDELIELLKGYGYRMESDVVSAKILFNELSQRKDLRIPVPKTLALFVKKLADKKISPVIQSSGGRGNCNTYERAFVESAFGITPRGFDGPFYGMARGTEIIKFARIQKQSCAECAKEMEPSCLKVVCLMPSCRKINAKRAKTCVRCKSGTKRVCEICLSK